MHQPALLAPVPAHAAFLRLELARGARPELALAPWLELAVPDHLLIGVGASLLEALGRPRPELRPMPPHAGVPHTPGDLWVRVAGADPGEVLHRERALPLAGWEVADRTLGFLYGESRDLTGYEDGTENPTGDDALRAAVARDGSSFLAAQRWLHDLDAFGRLPRRAQDHVFGRDRETNEELGDAPPSAHVKRTAQEGFTPEAFVVRRSMPWRDARGAGLVFLAFGRDLSAFEAQLARMMGAEDGIRDALLGFTRPVDGATWWLPPVRENGRLAL